MAQVEVLNILGQKVAESRSNTVDLTSFESGIYFLRVVSTEGQVWFEKVVRE